MGTKTTTTTTIIKKSASAQAQEQPRGDEATIETIRRAVNTSGHHYIVTQDTANVFHIQDGDLTSNILCGCFMQYYAYDIHLGTPDRVMIELTVPCNGWWGGAIGAAKTSDENARIMSAMSQAFPGRQVLRI